MHQQELKQRRDCAGWGQTHANLHDRAGKMRRAGSSPTAPQQIGTTNNWGNAEPSPKGAALRDTPKASAAEWTTAPSRVAARNIVATWDTALGLP